MQTVTVKPGAWKRPPVKTKVAPEDEPLFSRMIAKVAFAKETGCWEWQGAKSNGYSAVSVKGKPQRGHRVMYQLMVGEIPEGLQIDHLCCNRACINPRHLEPVTARQNSGTRVVLRRVGLMPVIGREPVPVTRYVAEGTDFADLDKSMCLWMDLHKTPESLRQMQELTAWMKPRHVKHDY